MSISIEEAILTYNFNQEDIEYMKEVEHIEHTDLHKLFEALNEHCVSRNCPLWQKYGIEDTIRKEGHKFGRGSRRLQFCKHCGETIWFDLKGETE
jgi:hypothetical protein